MSNTKIPAFIMLALAFVFFMLTLSKEKKTLYKIGFFACATISLGLSASNGTEHGFRHVIDISTAVIVLLTIGWSILFYRAVMPEKISMALLLILILTILQMNLDQTPATA